MRNFQEKRKWKNVMESKPILITLGIVVLVFAYSVFGLVGKMQETIKNKNIAQAKIADLQKTKDTLSANINQLNTVEGQEESIRNKFGWAKEGEGEIVIVDDKTQPTAATQANSSGFFSFFKNLFK